MLLSRHYDGNLIIRSVVLPYNELDTTVGLAITISGALGPEVGPVFDQDNSIEISSKVGSYP